MHISTEFLALVAVLGGFLTTADKPCNFQQVDGCPPMPGFQDGTYSIDFTSRTDKPAEWIVADNEYVRFGPQGAAFDLRDAGDAPYMWTRDFFQYAQYQVVMKIAPGTGVITSAVAYSWNQDEIDWEMSGNNFNNAHGSEPRVQLNVFGQTWQATGWQYRASYLPVGRDMVSNWINYTIDWSRDSLSWYIDGRLVRRDLRKDSNNTQTSVTRYPQAPMQLHLGVWAGGGPSQPPGTREWAGGPVDPNGYNYTAYVRSVRVTPYRNCSAYTPTDKTGDDTSFACVPPVPSSKTSSSSTSSSKSSSSTVASSLTSGLILISTTPSRSSSIGSSTKANSTTRSSTKSIDLSRITGSTTPKTSGTTFTINMNITKPSSVTRSASTTTTTITTSSSTTSCSSASCSKSNGTTPGPSTSSTTSSTRSSSSIADGITSSITFQNNSLTSTSNVNSTKPTTFSDTTQGGNTTMTQSESIVSSILPLTNVQPAADMSLASSQTLPANSNLCSTTVSSLAVCDVDAFNCGWAQTGQYDFNPVIPASTLGPTPVISNAVSDSPDADAPELESPPITWAPLHAEQTEVAADATGHPPAIPPTPPVLTAGASSLLPGFGACMSGAVLAMVALSQ